MGDDDADYIPAFAANGALFLCLIFAIIFPCLRETFYAASAISWFLTNDARLSNAFFSIWRIRSRLTLK